MGIGHTKEGGGERKIGNGGIPTGKGDGGVSLGGVAPGGPCKDGFWAKKGKLYQQPAVLQGSFLKPILANS